jgi:hypothetical protein
MSNDTHFGAGFGPSPVRRVPMPKFEFALEKFLEDRRKRSKEEADASGEATRDAGRMTPRDKSPGRS